MARRRLLAPLVTIKHYVNVENAVIANGTTRPIELIQAVNVNAVVNSGDVFEGSLVKTVFIEHWLKSNADATADTKFQLVVEKVPAGATSISFTQMNNLMSYPNKKNVLFVSQGVIGDGTTQSIPVVRQWFMIPKGKQRFGLDDRFVLTISTTAFGVNSCGIAIFKEWK